MGIGLKDTSWSITIANNKEANKKRVKNGQVTWYPDLFFSPSGKIITTPAADKYLSEHNLKYDNGGKPIIHTERGRRRQKRLKEK